LNGERIITTVGSLRGALGRPTATTGRFAFEPGWRWSECVKPVVGTDSCQVRHVGHDAWVVGDERFVALEFESQSAEEYARG
jgi:hypothetical protein